MKTASSDIAARMERLMRLNLDGTFRRVRSTDFGMVYETDERPHDFIPDYAHLIRVARGNHD